MMRSLVMALGLAFIVVASATAHGAEMQRGLLVTCAADAPPEVQAAAARIHAASVTNPLLAVFASGRAVGPVGNSRTLATGKVDALAYHHVVVVGLADDPLVQQAWQHEARIADGVLTAFGFGVLKGVIGWNEAGPNPWLHSAAVAKPPYESETVVVSGTTPAAVALAADALLRTGLANGAVAESGWTRPETTLLDRDPMPLDAAPPAWLAADVGGWQRVALTWCGADVARGILADAEIEPDACWLAKYHRTGVWDGAGGDASIVNFVAGLHRRAFLNAVLVARFPDAASAQKAASAVARAGKMKENHGVFRGSLKGYQDDRTPAGPLACWSRDAWLVMSSLPADIQPVKEAK